MPHAQELWRCHESPDRVEAHRQQLDREAARIGRALLSPFSSLLQERVPGGTGRGSRDRGQCRPRSLHRPARRYDRLMETERVRLRARTPDDADILHILWSNVDTHLVASGNPYVPRSAAGIRARIEGDLSAPIDYTADVWMVGEAVADGRVLGTAGLWGLSTYDQLAHLALTLLPEARGQGYGRELVALLCDYGFRLRNLRRLELETLASNTAMRRAAEANGFVQEGVQRERGYDGSGFGDMVIYGLLRTEWSPPQR